MLDTTREAILQREKWAVNRGKLDKYVSKTLSY